MSERRHRRARRCGLATALVAAALLSQTPKAHAQCEPEDPPLASGGDVVCTGVDLDGFQIADFPSALLGAILVSLTGWIGNAFIGERGRYEVVVSNRRR